MKKLYPLILDDGGRNLSKRPMQINDCAVRALAILSEMPYDAIYDELALAGRKSFDGFEIEPWLKKNNGKKLGGKFKKVNPKLLTPEYVHVYYDTGKYLLISSTHTWAMVDGVSRDLWRFPQDEPLYSVWKFTKSNEPKKSL